MTITNRRRFATRLAALLGALTVAAPTAAHPSTKLDAMTTACREAFARLSLNQQALVVKTIALLVLPRQREIVAAELEPFFTPPQAAAQRENDREMDALIASYGGAR